MSVVEFKLPPLNNGCFNNTDPAIRRDAQIKENQDIGEGSEVYPLSEVLSEQQMLGRYVYIIEGKRIVDLEYPRRLFKLDEWKSAHRSSQTTVAIKKDNGKVINKQVETSGLWETAFARQMVDTITFRPGCPRMTFDPAGKSAANTWRAIDRQQGGDPDFFMKHVEYLFGTDAPRFLDWLAHIEQYPGVLPHNGWVHVSPSQGTGRNWLASVLVRIWKGYVAASFDLSRTLSTNFNGSLSQKLLAIVDEINEGVSDKRFDGIDKLKSLVTEEERPLNPKYGHQSMEFNVCRWLLFSNHSTALPLYESDRRWNIVRNDKAPMTPAYYGQLYSALKDPAFIAGVAWMLRTRDISAFNPGAHAVMNEAKRDMVAATKSEADDTMTDIVANHPADVIANSTLGELLNNNVPRSKITPHQRHAVDRAGVRPYGKALRIGTTVIKVSILRNYEFWKQAEPEQIRVELGRGRAV
jgi:hypothetical protein